MSPLRMVWLAALLVAAVSSRGLRRTRPTAAPTEEPPAPTRPHYIECQTSAECDDRHCCVLGGDRYSIPTCRPMHAIGEVCRPNGLVPFNTTVGYPDMSQVELSVFWLFCPCAEGLACHRESHSCQASPDHNAP